MTSKKYYRAIFLDRDGVVNKVIVDNEKPLSPRKFDEFELLPMVAEAIDLFKEIGYLNIIITNQPDIARGRMNSEELEKMHKLIRESLSIDDILVCSHDDGDKCHCRKPKPGMLLDAASKWNIDLKKSYLIGDTWKDMEAAKSVGCKFFLIDMPYNRDIKNEHRVKDLTEALNVINNTGIV